MWTTFSQSIVALGAMIEEQTAVQSLSLMWRYTPTRLNWQKQKKRRHMKAEAMCDPNLLFHNIEVLSNLKGNAHGPQDVRSTGKPIENCD